MVIIGLLLLLLAVLVAVAAISKGGDPAQLNLQLFTIKTNVTGVYVAGAITLLVGVLGLWLVLAGIKRDRRRRGQIKELRRRAAAPNDGAASQDPAATTGDGSDDDAHFRSAPRDQSG